MELRLFIANVIKHTFKYTPKRKKNLIVSSKSIKEKLFSLLIYKYHIETTWHTDNQLE